MATTTVNLGLTKPTVGADQDQWGGQINASLDVLDAKVFDKTTGGVITGRVEVNGPQQGNIVFLDSDTLDLSLGNYFTRTINANATFVFTNPPSGKAFGFTLELNHTSGTVTWPTAVKWSRDAAPSLTIGKTHLFVFVTDDGGVTYRGAALVDYTT